MNTSFAEQTKVEFERFAPDWSITVFDCIDSTMNASRALMSTEDTKLPHCVIAGEQDAGRGRDGRIWTSSPGGFYATYMVSAAADGARLSGFSLMVGATIANLFEKYGLKIQLKWPNDLMSADGKKLGGILIETVPRAKETLLLIGIGINFDNPIDSATMSSVRSLGAASVQREEWGAELATMLEHALLDFVQQGLRAELGRWSKRDFLLGKSVEIESGDKIITGIADGISSLGALRIVTSLGIEEIWSGHITKVAHR